ncbi:MAG: hypothetical protein IPP19_07010 [Verrucomicrobia bacterium]|nr:hypothetical protein [Verrucomicrobiota bacterium]
MPPSLFPGADGLGFRRWMIVVAACLFAIWAGATLADSPYMVFAGFAGLLYVGTLSVNARTLAWLVIALQPAALIVPFFPGRPFWWELCALLAWPSLLAYGLLNRQKIAELKFDRLERRALVALAGYIIVLVSLMLFRGVGFRAFGGGQMGGRFYVQQVILAVVPLLIIVADPSRRQLFWVTVVGWLMSLTYLVSDLAFSLTGGSMQRILFFFELPTDAINFVVGFEVTGMWRFQSLWYVAAAGLACIWTAAPLRDLFGRYFFVAGPMMLGLLIMGLASGHRTLAVMVFTTLVSLSIFQRFWNPLRMIVGLCVVVAFTVTLYIVAEHLPLPVQRSISFLPGIEVDPLAERNATDTIKDRIGILELAVKDIPKYALLGRGFGMERLDLLPTDTVNDNVTTGYVNGIFYNGTLGLLLKTGLPGFICALIYIYIVSRIALELVRRVRQVPMDSQTWFDRFCYLVSAQWFSMVTFFYFLHGDASLWVQNFALPSALILICRRKQLGDPTEQLVKALPFENTQPN